MFRESYLWLILVSAEQPTGPAENSDRCRALSDSLRRDDISANTLTNEAIDDNA